MVFMPYPNYQLGKSMIVKRPMSASRTEEGSRNTGFKFVPNKRYSKVTGKAKRSVLVSGGQKYKPLMVKSNPDLIQPPHMVNVDIISFNSFRIIQVFQTENICKEILWRAQIMQETTKLQTTGAATQV